MVNYTKLSELAAGKPIAIGECGDLPGSEILDKQPDWTWFMCWAGYLKRNKTEVILDLYNDPRVISRKPSRDR
jgi:mannan endo-1,4-beta-mannosidase